VTLGTAGSGSELPLPSELGPVFFVRRANDLVDAGKGATNYGRRPTISVQGPPADNRRQPGVTGRQRAAVFYCASEQR
jgi:hypothetical protein